MSNRTRIFLVVAATLISIALIWPNIGTRTVRVYLKEELSAADREKSFAQLNSFLSANYKGKFTWQQKTGINIEAEEKKEESAEKSTAKEETYLAVQGNFVQTAFLNELSRQQGVDPARVLLEPMWVEKKVKAKPFKLGLDLQGGMNLVLKGDFPKLEEQVKRQYPQSFFDETNKQLAEEKDEEKKKILQNKLDSAKRALDFSDERKQQDIEGALEIIRSRIDSTGVSEPLIRLHGNDRIEVSLPGVASPEQAKRVISSTARVAYHIHDPRGEAGRLTSEASKSFPEFEVLETEYRRQEFIRNLEKKLNFPKNLGIYVYYERRADEKGKVLLRPANFLVVENEPALTGEAMSRNVYANFDPDRMQHTVDFELTSDGRDKFAKITTDNKGKQLAILIDGKIRSAPSINEPITGGSAQISGSFSQQEAKDLALIIKEGALPVPMVIDEERSVGPTLGKEAIEKGLNAILLGLIFVVVYMVLYYHGAGLIADVALVFNVLFMAAIFALLDFTITLPGLAGVVLTLGMAVDANVIIYERIREELARGKSLKNAVSAGFERATLTILDANLTTLIVAVLLASKLGAGPIKGFGVTLFIGIISTLFTALVMTRAIIEGLVFSLNIKSLSLGFGKHRKAGKLAAAEGR